MNNKTVCQGLPELKEQSKFCADCGCEIGFDDGPPDGWELEDGRIVCQECCIKSLKKVAREAHHFMLRSLE
jgi:hypothetical protein